MKTFRDITAGTDAVEFREDLEDEMYIAASCWTDDEDVLDMEAMFSVTTSWGYVGRYDLDHADVRDAIDRLCGRIEDAFGGRWRFMPGDSAIVQA